MVARDSYSYGEIIPPFPAKRVRIPLELLENTVKKPLKENDLCQEYLIGRYTILTDRPIGYGKLLEDTRGRKAYLEAEEEWVEVPCKQVKNLFELIHKKCHILAHSRYWHFVDEFRTRTIRHRKFIKYVGVRPRSRVADFAEPVWEPPVRRNPVPGVCQRTQIQPIPRNLL